MKKALFLVTELERPVGGLHRYSTEFLPAWRNAVRHGKAEWEPLVLSLHNPALPLGDLVPSAEFKGFPEKNVKVYEAVRGGEKCFFLEPKMDDGEYFAFLKELWEKYRIKSEKASNWDYYRLLCGFWKYAPVAAEFLARERGHAIRLADAQDWLAFPAGFLCKERLGIPLHCRYHSGEFGRSMGLPDLDAPPVRIEAAGLMEADFVQGVSVDEARFEVYHLLPLKQELSQSLSQTRGPKWREQQDWKDGLYEDFLLYEPEDLEVSGQNAAGLPNGIILDDWKKVDLVEIYKGREILRGLFPKKYYVLFIGRIEKRKGIDELMRAFAQIAHKHDAGLVVSSNFSQSDYDAYRNMARGLGIEGSVAIYSGWLDEKLKKGLFCACDVIALPSLYEPFGLVTLEGLAADMACEKNHVGGPAVVVGDTGGMKEVIRNGVNGFKAPMDEDKFELKPEYLARILDMLLRDEALRKRISRGGASRVQSQHFDWSFIAARVMESYAKAAENHNKWHFEK
ncbi:MAG: glycosyltransferase family 4 protein [Candidatus Micrarchaeia archaeon]|jgi:glycosyltransferase involved in cell wall biosynthesis